MKSSFLTGLCITGFLFVWDSQAVTLEEIHHDPNLTPENFAPRFARFKFVFNADVQRPEDFLASEAGDCDDFATLAAAELNARGFHARLVSIRLKNVVHVVCYVQEANGYLDYNLRARGSGLVPCGPDLAEMATAVAKSFKSNWTSVSEFTFNDGVKRLVATSLAKDRTRLTASSASPGKNSAAQ